MNNDINILITMQKEEKIFKTSYVVGVLPIMMLIFNSINVSHIYEIIIITLLIKENNLYTSILIFLDHK